MERVENRILTIRGHRVMCPISIGRGCSAADGVVPGEGNAYDVEIVDYHFND